MTPAKLIAKLAGKSLSFDDIPGGGRPEFDVAAGGLALSGLEPKYMAAILYRWGDDRTQKKILKKALWREAIKTQKRERWPLKRKGRKYLISLINIALMEEQPADVRIWGKDIFLDPETSMIQRKLLRMGVFWPVAMGVSILEWRVFYSKKYEFIRGLLNNWCSIAHEKMRTSMKNEENIE